MTPAQLAKTGSEHAEQTAFFQWLAMEAVAHDRAGSVETAAKLRMVFAIPNGDQRGDGSHKGAQIAGARLKAEGMRSGVPDVFCAVPLHISRADGSGLWQFGLFIEMKRVGAHTKKNGDCSDEQLDWHERLRSQGFAVAVCYGGIHARDTILSYLGLIAALVPWD